MLIEAQVPQAIALCSHRCVFALDFRGWESNYARNSESNAGRQTCVTKPNPPRADPVRGVSFYVISLADSALAPLVGR